MEYTVTWSIELDAETPLEAADLARSIQLDSCNEATAFTVVGSDRSVHEINILDT